MNKRYNKTASLLKKNFRRKIVASEAHFKKLIYYAHNNLFHHKFTEIVIENTWTSYGTVVSSKSPKLQRVTFL